MCFALGSAAWSGKADCSRPLDPDKVVELYERHAKPQALRNFNPDDYPTLKSLNEWDLDDLTPLEISFKTFPKTENGEIVLSPPGEETVIELVMIDQYNRALHSEWILESVTIEPRLNSDPRTVIFNMMPRHLYENQSDDWLSYPLSAVVVVTQRPDNRADIELFLNAGEEQIAYFSRPWSERDPVAWPK